jgi:hypothetical protein
MASTSSAKSAPSWRHRSPASATHLRRCRHHGQRQGGRCRLLAWAPLGLRSAQLPRPGRLLSKVHQGLQDDRDALNTAVAQGGFPEGVGGHALKRPFSTSLILQMLDFDRSGDANPIVNLDVLWYILGCA